MQGDGWLNFEPGTWNCGHDVELWLRISIWILSRSVCRLPSILEQCGHHQSKPDPCHQSTWSEKKNQLFWTFVCCLYLSLKVSRTNRYTGKSLSEALIFASTNPRYDDRLFIELPVLTWKLQAENMLCTKIVFCFCFGIQNNFCTQRVLNLYFSCTEVGNQWTICRHIVG